MIVFFILVEYNGFFSLTSLIGSLSIDLNNNSVFSTNETQDLSLFTISEFVSNTTCAPQS